MKRAIRYGVTFGVAATMAVGVVGVTRVLMSRRTAPVSVTRLRADVPLAAAHLRSGEPFRVATQGLLAGDRRRVDPEGVHLEDLDISIEGAAPAGASITAQGGMAIVPRGDVDVMVGTRPGGVEVAFVARHAGARLPRLRFARGGTSLAARTEPLTGATLVVDASGETVARVSAPVAFDHANRTRRGSYAFGPEGLSVELDTRDLTPPIVIDPEIVMPLWTVEADDRAPGTRTYDADRISRELTMTVDTDRDRIVAVRPVKTRAKTEAAFLFGDPLGGERGTQQLSPLIAEDPGATTRDAWQRGHFLESETWERGPAGWAPITGAHLPGLVDPAMAYDETRKRVVLFGGARMNLSCAYTTGSATTYTKAQCSTAGPHDATFEYDGAAWIQRPLAQAPSPRLRGAMAYDKAHQRVVLFGGRALPGPGESRMVDPRGVPFPESVAGDLLNDTWTYDGSTWQRLTTSDAPPPREGATLVADVARGVLVLTGGHQADDAAGRSDRFDVWELDSLGWTRRIAAGAPELPATLRTRTGAVASVDPLTKRVTWFGGRVDRIDDCALTQAAVDAVVATTSPPPAALVETGCLGGYVHDRWTWDGKRLSQITSVRYSETVDGLPVFREVADVVPPPATDSGPPGTHRWWGIHGGALAAPRGPLQRSFTVDTVPPPGPPATPVTTAPLAPAGAVFRSPSFALRERPLAGTTLDGLALLTDDGSATVRSSVGTWSHADPPASPFASGESELLAVTWDGAGIVAFDPRTGRTHRRTLSAGWSQIALGASPPAWGLPAAVRSLRDLPVAPLSAKDARELPAMTHDAARGVAVMLYQGALWELSNGAWHVAPAPAGGPSSAFAACATGTALRFDPDRARVVIVGCTLPSSTYEWDGTALQGPSPGPFQDRVRRDTGDVSNDPYLDAKQVWSGSVESTWLHPDALRHLPGRGVSVVDRGGTLRSWTGAAWVAGPGGPGGPWCAFSQPGTSVRANPLGFPFPITAGFMTAREQVPTCMSPPLLDDRTHGRVSTGRPERDARAAHRRRGLPGARSRRRVERRGLGHVRHPGVRLPVGADVPRARARRAGDRRSDAHVARGRRPAGPPGGGLPTRGPHDRQPGLAVSCRRRSRQWRFVRADEPRGPVEGRGQAAPRARRDVPDVHRVRAGLGVQRGGRLLRQGRLRRGHVHDWAPTRACAR